MEVTSYYNVMFIPACSIGLNALTVYLSFGTVNVIFNIQNMNCKVRICKDIT
jgi:hypothetical protein